MRRNKTESGGRVYLITYDELKKIAALAKLSIDGENAQALTEDISGIIEFADAVAGAEIPEDGDAEYADGEECALRGDEPAPSAARDAILLNAGRRRDGYFTARNASGGAR